MYHYGLSILLTLFILSGCTNTPSPQSDKEIEAQKAIAANLSEAEQAKSEYLALQQKRRSES